MSTHETKWDHYDRLREFLKAWTLYHDYWRSQAVPISTYRFEDLLTDEWAVVDNVLQASGLWEKTSVTRARVDAARVMPSLNPDAGVSSHDFYSREMYLSLSASEIREALADYRPVLARYGYDLLYEVWLDAIEGREADEAVTAEQIKHVMAITRGMSNWGAYWRG